MHVLGVQDGAIGELRGGHDHAVVHAQAVSLCQGQAALRGSLRSEERRHTTRGAASAASARLRASRTENFRRRVLAHSLSTWTLTDPARVAGSSKNASARSVSPTMAYTRTLVSKKTSVLVIGVRAFEAIPCGEIAGIFLAKLAQPLDRLPPCPSFARSPVAQATLGRPRSRRPRQGRARQRAWQAAGQPSCFPIWRLA